MMSSAPHDNRHRPRWRRLVIVAAGLAVVGCALQPRLQETTEPQFDSTLHAQLPSQIRGSGTLRIATDAAYAPINFFAPDGRTVIGFEPDLATALGDILGVRVRFIVTDFEDSLTKVENGEVDVVLSGMTDTEERERHADFINYFRAGTSILVQRGNPHGITDLDDLCSQVVAVERGTVQVDLLQRSQNDCFDEPIQVRTYPTNADALIELRTGRAAAVLNDYPPAAYVTTDPRTQADYQLASDTQYEPGLYGIAVARHQPQLRDAIRAALEQVLASGTYERLLARWDLSEGTVDTVTVNAG
jgi:polar amino acid transport system substrate-binding protein